MIASAKKLLAFQAVRAGAPFANVTTRGDVSTVDISQFVYNGNTFFGSNDQTSFSPANIRFPARFGAPFKDVTTKASIDAGGFDYYRQGSPFYVYYGGPPPEVTFNAAQFFMLF